MYFGVAKYTIELFSLELVCFVSKVAAFFLVPVIRIFVFGSVECTIFSLELIM